MTKKDEQSPPQTLAEWLATRLKGAGRVRFWTLLNDKSAPVDAGDSPGKRWLDVASAIAVAEQAGTVAIHDNSDGVFVEAIAQ